VTAYTTLDEQYIYSYIPVNKSGKLFVGSLEGGEKVFVGGWGRGERCLWVVWGRGDREVLGMGDRSTVCGRWGGCFCGQGVGHHVLALTQLRETPIMDRHVVGTLGGRVRPTPH